MKSLLIIPGFGENGKEKQYSIICKNAQKAGYKTHILVPEWGRTTLSQCTEEIRSKVTKMKVNTTETVLLGFSFGAFIGLELCKKEHFNNFLCCSCSPYFKENLIDIPKDAVLFFGKRRMSDFEKFSIKDLKDLKTKKIDFYFGDQDWNIGIMTMEKIATQTNSKLKIIKDTGHELNVQYIEVIDKKIQ